MKGGTKMSAGRRVRVEVQPEKGLGRLAILLKEILKQIPVDVADELVEATRHGKSFSLNIQENTRGAGFVCAFQWEVCDRFETGGVYDAISYLDPDVSSDAT
jgi:hypothetical protein